MAHATEIALWKPILGTGRKVTSGSGSNVSDTVKMGSQTYACLLSCITDNVMVTLTASPGVAATATTDMLLKTSDPPIAVRCAPGDILSAYGLGGAGVVYITELSH